MSPESELTNYQIASDMSKLTKTHMHASTVTSFAVAHQLVSDMNELTRERSHIHASIVKSALVTHQTAQNMKTDT